MSEVIELKTAAERSRDKLIEMLADALESVRSDSEYVAVGIAMVKADGRMTIFHVAEDNLAGLIGAVAYLQHRIHRQISQD